MAMYSLSEDWEACAGEEWAGVSLGKFGWIFLWSLPS